MPEFQFQPDRNCWRVERASCFSFIIDGQGKILYRFAGPLVGDDYRQRFLPELEKARAVE